MFGKLKKYITPLLAAGACPGRDRCRTDGVRSRSAVLQRERLANCLPVARTRSDQDFPGRCSAPPRRRHARSDGTGLRAGPRPVDMNGRTSSRSRTGVGALVREGTPMLKLVSGDGGRRPGPTRGRNHPPPRLTVQLDRHPLDTK